MYINIVKSHRTLLYSPPLLPPQGLGPAGPWALVGPCRDRALSGPLQIRKSSYFQPLKALNISFCVIFNKKNDFESPKTSETHKQIHF